ncbi:hypothetical protein, partial [Petralouisia muris]|uniref:hypothetical protein n=1 Tax=Petralouisia muris TaxID=3032872 RepID=UPI0023B796EB
RKFLKPYKTRDSSFREYTGFIRPEGCLALFNCQTPEKRAGIIRQGIKIKGQGSKEWVEILFENVEINGQKGLYCMGMVMSIDFSFKQSFINFQPVRLTNYFLSANIKSTVSLQTIGGCRFHACGKRSGRT